MSEFPALFFHHEAAGLSRAEPRVTPQLLHPAPPHHAELTPTIQMSFELDYPQALYLALMERLPANDGTGGQELRTEAYLRQAITLAPRSATHFCVPRRVVFEVHRCPMIAGFGLFDSSLGGRLCGYGAIWASRTSLAPVERIEVASHQMLIKKIRPDAGLMS